MVEPHVATEVDRQVNCTGAVALAGRQRSVGYHFAGRRVTVRIDRGVLQLVDDGVLLRSLPNSLTTAELVRIRDARPAGPPPVPVPEPVRVERRISARGALAVAGQQVPVGMVHAGRTVTVESSDTTWRTYHGDGCSPKSPASPPSRLPASKPANRSRLGDVHRLSRRPGALPSRSSLLSMGNEPAKIPFNLEQ